MGCKFLLVFICLVGFYELSNGVQIHFRYLNNYLYQTTIRVGNSSKDMTILLDLTGTDLWLFGSKTASNTSVLLSSNSTSNQTQGNQTTLIYSDAQGLYDNSFNVSAVPYVQGTVMLDGNYSLGQARFGLVQADKYPDLRKKDTLLGAGIIGVGRNQQSNLTNYLQQLFNVTTAKFVLCTRPPFSQALLIINENFFNDSMIANATTTLINQQNKIKQGAFEFNLTSVRIGSGYYAESVLPATISTLSSFVTVDQRTWNYIDYKFKPVFDKNTQSYLVNCWLMRRLRIQINVQQVKNATTPLRPLMIPGSDLVSLTKKGYCVLKIRPGKTDSWVLGAPFIRHHCIQFDLQKQQITFVNNSIFYPWKKHIYG
ncbi:hypothetical protein M3Y97_00315200 [Aphelenchoides bicaudatus]|nr:hypothetical protein M3Y97_00315200 [Aphelenchoides bicaudatus]